MAPGLFAAFILNEQLPVPTQTTPHPANDEPALGVAESTTAAPFGTLAVQAVVPQVKAMGLPDAVPDTVPVAVPFSWTLSG